MKKILFIILFQAMFNHAWAMEGAALQPYENKGLICTIDQKNLHWAINLAWDSVRAARISYETYGIYDHVYIVTGADIHNGELMKETWKRALSENDCVDYFSFVHGGDQWIKKEWGVDKDSHKIRVVYSEGCHGGSGKEHFVEEYGALLSAGHDGKENSYSPFFSFRFLEAWLQGKSFKKALDIAWAEGQENLKSDFGTFVTKKLIGSSLTVEQQIEGSTIHYAGSVDPADFFIYSPFKDGGQMIFGGTAR